MTTWKPIGNPYSTLLTSSNETTTVAAWGRTGFRRGLTNYPWYVDAKAGDLIVTEKDGHRVQIFDVLGNETRFEPQGCYGHGKNQFYNPCGVTTTNISGANVVVADSGNRRVVLMKIASDLHGYGLLETTLSFGNQMFQQPMGVEHDLNRNYLVVTDPGAGRVSLHDLRDGSPAGEMRPPPSCPLQLPADVAIDELSRVYVTDAAAGCVHVYDKNGDFIMMFGKGELSKPWGICFDRQFNLLIADEAKNRIVMYTPGGRLNKVVEQPVYLPKGISVNCHERLVVATGDPLNFLKIIQYK